MNGYKRTRWIPIRFQMLSPITSSDTEISAIDLVIFIRILLIHEKMGHMAPMAMKNLLLNYSADVLGYILDELNLYIKYFNCAAYQSDKTTYRLLRNADRLIMPHNI